MDDINYKIYVNIDEIIYKMFKSCAQADKLV